MMRQAAEMPNFHATFPESLQQATEDLAKLCCAVCLSAQWLYQASLIITHSFPMSIELLLWLQNLIYCVMEFMEDGDLYTALAAETSEERQLGWFDRYCWAFPSSSQSSIRACLHSLTQNTASFLRACQMCSQGCSLNIVTAAIGKAAAFA